MNNRRTTVKLSPEVFDQVNRLAKKTGCTLSNIIRISIAEYLQNWRDG
jgi:predicted DNA-binding protein